MTDLEITFKGRSITFRVPDNWDECDAKLYRKIIRLMIAGDFSTPNMRLFLKRIIGLPRAVVGRMVEEEVNQVMNCIKWCLDPPRHADGKSGWWLIFRGPRAGFQNVTGMQYGLADQHFGKYLDAIEKGDSKKAVEHQRKMCACIMTPFGMNFRSWMPDIQSRIFKLMSAQRRMIMIYEFWGMRNFLSDHFPAAFEKSSGEGDGYGWPGMFEAMAGEKFGPVSQVKREKIYDIYLHVEQSIQRMREMERRQKNRKK